MTKSKRKSVLEAAIKKMTEGHHIDSVIEAIVKEMGGVKRLAQTFKEEFHKAPEGSPVKARMMDVLLNMLESRSKTDHSDTIELLDDEDLERVARELMEEGESEDARTI